MSYKFWFITGSQSLYGDETLKKAGEDAQIIAGGLNECGRLPYPVLCKGIMKSTGEITDIARKANADDECAGVIVYMHTFSPSKMWITGLSLLQKPYLHLHTQFNEIIPNDEMDMDYMNLHQSAHGDREHGFIGARMRIARKIVAGYWKDTDVQERVGRWMRSAVGAAFSRSLKVMRFGDNMRDVAVTEGDKVEAQIKLGWEVNTWPVGELAEAVERVSDAEAAEKMEEYRELYAFRSADPAYLAAVEYQAREEIAIRKMLDSEGCGAFANTFQDLVGLEQLPGIATQNLMRAGFGYGAEGDWKTAAMTAVVKEMTRGMSGGTSFMEDYAYDYKNGLSMGAHMLEVCPTVASERPVIEVHELSIGGKQPPARLVFEGAPGKGVVASLIDMGGRMRLIVQDIECVKPHVPLPNLPVARVMWKPQPSLTAGAECWLLAGGAHHTVLSLDCDAEMLRDWARIMDIEFVHITAGSDPVAMERELMLADLAWKLR